MHSELFKHYEHVKSISYIHKIGSFFRLATAPLNEKQIQLIRKHAEVFFLTLSNTVKPKVAALIYQTLSDTHSSGIETPSLNKFFKSIKGRRKRNKLMEMFRDKDEKNHRIHLFGFTFKRKRPMPIDNNREQSASLVSMMKALRETKANKVERIEKLGIAKNKGWIKAFIKEANKKEQLQDEELKSLFELMIYKMINEEDVYPLNTHAVAFFDFLVEKSRKIALK